MVEIIRPKFERKYHQKMRMLRSKPTLANHPDFQNIAEPKVEPKKESLGAFAVLAALGILIFSTIRRR